MRRISRRAVAAGCCPICAIAPSLRSIRCRVLEQTTERKCIICNLISVQGVCECYLWVRPIVAVAVIRGLGVGTRTWWHGPRAARSSRRCRTRVNVPLRSCLIRSRAALRSSSRPLRHVPVPAVVVAALVALRRPVRSVSLPLRRVIRAPLRWWHLLTLGSWRGPPLLITARGCTITFKKFIINSLCTLKRR